LFGIVGAYRGLSGESIAKKPDELGPRKKRHPANENGGGTGRFAFQNRYSDQ